MAEEIKNYKCPDCGADLLDWRHFNRDVLRGPDGNDFECAGRLCGKQWEAEDILQNLGGESE